MRTLVCYTSRSGFTRTYAQWIAHSLDADLLPLKQVGRDGFADYDCIIYGGSLHAVGINGIRKIKSHWDTLAEKQLVIFAVGATPAAADVVNIVRDANFSAEQQRQLTLFYVRGGFDYGRLSLPDRVLMTLMKWKILLKRHPDEDEQGMLRSYAKPFDATDEAAISPMLEHVRSLG
jgi:menaquinone-dependent protoporphyrinogen IX oxidase